MASMLITGGPIATMTDGAPWAEAVVVRGDVITYVGAAAGAAAFTDAGTEVVDLAGGTLLPGFVDAHDHLVSMAVTKIGINVAGLDGRQAICDAVAAWLPTQPTNGVLRGYGWSPGTIDGGSPRREWLDAVTGDRPMYLLSYDSHDMWMNTAALALAGVDANTPDPDPGSQYFARDADGTPTGHVVEGAPILMMLKALGTLEPDVLREGQRLTLDRAASWGITTYMDAGVLVGTRSADAEAAYRDLIARDLRGELDVRVVGTVWTRDTGDDPVAIAAELTDWNQRMRSPHVQISVLKMWADGTLFSGGALLLEPLANGMLDGGLGRMTFSPEAIEAQIAAAEEAGFDMHVHIDADGSCRVVLDAIERVRARHGERGVRHCIAHNAVVHPDDVQRFAPLGVLANVTPLWGTDYNGEFIDLYDDMFGPERVQERLYPYGDLVRSGAVVTYGSDIPGVDIDEIPPLMHVEAAVTRKRPGYPDDRAFVPRQAIDLYAALKCQTINGAYQLRMEDQIGSIEVGKKADLVVLAADIFTGPPDAIHRAPVVMTMMDGRVTFRAGATT